VTPKITRRNFLKIATLGAGASILAGCANPRRWVTLEPYVRPPEEQLAGVATWYASTCRMCPAGCGIIVRIMNGRALKIEGNPEHPLNRGKLCARGQAGLQLLYNPDRLNAPVTQASRGSHQFKAITWEEGINTLFARLQDAGSQVAVLGGSSMSGHVYDILGRLSTAVGAGAPVIYDPLVNMNGYAALADVDMALFGKAALPTYDLGNADIVISFGADLLGPGISQVRYGIEYGKFRSGKLGQRGYLVQLEPHMSLTGAKADLWLPVQPGMEGLVAQAIISLIATQSFAGADPQRVERAKLFAGPLDVSKTAAATGINPADLIHLAQIFAEAQHPLAIPGGGLSGLPDANASLTAVQALNTIAGATGQPGVPGGMSLSAEAPLPKLFVKAQPSTFADMLALLSKMKAGAIKVLLVLGPNPAYELPVQAGFAEALAKVPFVVSFAPIVDETAAQADLILPERTYLESWGYDVANPAFDAAAVSSQQPVVTPLFDARSAADVLLTAAKGIPAAAKVLPWSDEVAFLKEIVAQLPPDSSLGAGGVVWERYLQHGGWFMAPQTATGAPAAETLKPQPLQLTAPKFQGDAGQYPYFLHLYVSSLLSDGRGANLPWLQASPDPLTTGAWQTLIEINPATAQNLGLVDGEVVKVTSPYGEIQGYVYTYPAMRPDTVAIATGQGHTDYGRYASQHGSNPLQLVGAQLAWSSVRVNLTGTGSKVKLSIFEWKPGVQEGFPNQAFPGE
jgi:anaerobic selenocysteine-containing dehydrogenase